MPGTEKKLGVARKMVWILKKQHEVSYGHRNALYCDYINIRAPQGDLPQICMMLPLWETGQKEQAIFLCFLKTACVSDFPGFPVVKNSPTSAWDMV